MGHFAIVIHCNDKHRWVEAILQIQDMPYEENAPTQQYQATAIWGGTKRTNDTKIRNSKLNIQDQVVLNSNVYYYSDVNLQTD